MGFSKKIKEAVLIASARHCCVCHRYKGLRIEVHHVVPESRNGPNTFDNAISLCFDCHTDAGHYNQHHPRGSKLSTSELIKARDKWYGIVKSRSLGIPFDSANQIHIRYLICQDDFDAFRIAKGDMSILPIQKTLLVNNEVLRFIQRMEATKMTETRTYPPELHYDNAAEYLKDHPDARVLDKSDPSDPYFDCERIPSIEELKTLDYFGNKCLKMMLEAGAKPEMVCRLRAYAQYCGVLAGNKIYTESLFVNPIWYAFLIISNAGSNSVLFRDLKGSYISQIRSFRPFSSAIQEQYSFRLPTATIVPGESILIPLVKLVAPLQSFDLRSTHIHSDSSAPDMIRQFSKVEGYGPHQSKFFVFGPEINPASITFEIDGISFNNPIPVFNLERLYTLSCHWLIGSCPHLFWMSANGVICYEKELFARSPNAIQEESFTVPEGFDELVVAELENETTFIKSIFVNEILQLQSVTLNKGDTLRLFVHPKDQIKIIGKYQSVHLLRTPDALLQRSHLIGAFMHSNPARYE